MIDLVEYYKNNVKKEDYYYRFYNQLITIPEKEQKAMEELDWIGNEYIDDTRFEVFDEEDAIKRFKELCEPDEDMTSNNDNIDLFYYICFFLKDSGYCIEEFPRLLERPPLEPFKFTYNEIRDKAIERGMVEENGTVKYNSRRKIVADFHFVKKGIGVKIDDNINKKFQEISTRNAKFEAMSTDEKIKEIINLIENLLKENGKYIKLDYKNIALDVLNDDIITSFKKKIQCFRHSSEEAIKERQTFTENQKKFIIDYGIMICNLIYYNRKQKKVTKLETFNHPYPQII